MEKVTGIGGLFFRAHDPKALGLWYLQHLGISLTPSSNGDRVWQQDAGPTVFSPFPETTKYFGDPKKMWMVNFRVRDLDKMVAQLRTAGIEVKVYTQSDPNGRFAHLHDPEGNPIELWQPSQSGAPHWVLAKHDSWRITGYSEVMKMPSPTSGGRHAGAVPLGVYLCPEKWRCAR